MDKAAIADSYRARLPLLHTLARTLDEKARQALDGVPHVDRISFREKDCDSFVEKATNPDKGYKNPLAEIEDQVGGRVITFFRDDIDVVRAKLIGWFGAVERVVREPAGDAEFGYESEHFVFVINDNWKPEGWADQPNMPPTFELQIRTLFMHAWAEPQHDLGYKNRTDAELSRDDKRELAWVAASAWGADRTLTEVARRLLSAKPQTNPTGE